MRAFFKTLFALILFTKPLFCGAQVKYEREYGLKSNQIPRQARSFVAACLPLAVE
jgi:hypothetical protein